MENMPEEIQNLVYENYAICDSNKEHSALKNVRQDYIRYLVKFKLAFCGLRQTRYI